MLLDPTVADGDIIYSISGAIYLLTSYRDILLHRKEKPRSALFRCSGAIYSL